MDERVTDELLAQYATHTGQSHIGDMARELIALRAELAALKSGEPVAWNIYSVEGRFVSTVQNEIDRDFYLRCGGRARPLYTHPATTGGAMQGWQLVPEQPTEEMLAAGCQYEPMGDMEGRYRAMLAAAPSAREDAAK